MLTVCAIIKAKSTGKQETPGHRSTFKAKTEIYNLESQVTTFFDFLTLFWSKGFNNYELCLLLKTAQFVSTSKMLYPFLAAIF